MVAGLLLAVLLPATVAAQRTPQPYHQSVEFRYQGRALLVPATAGRVEALPVLGLIGAEAAFSPAAGTYGVALGEQIIQFAPGLHHVLVDGSLHEADSPPVASPGGVAVSLDFLERSLLSPLGFHLESTANGYRIEPGRRYADPVTIRPAAADFGATTTVVLTLDRAVEATVEKMPDGSVVVRFPDARPQIDPSSQLRSSRVRDLRPQGQELRLRLPTQIGLLAWHSLADPPRLILELGRAEPTPTPNPERIVEIAGPSPIVIDPGHGGDDVGAEGSDGGEEKTVVMAIARRLAAALEARGHAIRLTREGDESRALTDRTAVANRLDARVFVSLHANASTVPSVHGAETYYMSLDRTATDEAAAQTAAVENRAGRSEERRSPLDLILWDLAQTDVLNESARLALAVQRRLNARLGTTDRGVKQAPFAVLTGATMPAVLIEVGFLSNPTEARLLADPAHQQRIADAIADGIEDFVDGS